MGKEATEPGFGRFRSMHISKNYRGI